MIDLLFMKFRYFFPIILLVSISALARLVVPFSSWDRLKESSPSIVVVLCGKPVPPDADYAVVGGPRSDSEVEIVAVLKGTNGLGPARLQTDHELRQGENYLVFGNFSQGICASFEQYKVVPIGERFSTNSIAGKPLDEQIKTLFQHALFKLNREIQQDQEQKQQLELLVGKS